MFKPLLTALIHQMVQFLTEKPDFFKANQDARKAMMENLKIPKPFCDVLEKSEETEFLRDLGGVVSYINAPKETALKKNPFMSAFIEFLTGPFAMRVEIMNDKAHLSEEDRQVVAFKLLPNNNTIADALRHLLLTYSYQELAAAIHELGQKIAKAPYLVIQSPRPIDLELKKEIREALYKEYPLSFPIFQINQNLIGGLRLFKGGKVIDHSWMGRVHRFTSLTF